MNRRAVQDPNLELVICKQWLCKSCRGKGEGRCSLSAFANPAASARHAIRRLRKDAGYSQESFADRCGVHRTYMGSVERGETNISLDNIERIARALRLTPAQLLAEAERER